MLQVDLFPLSYFIRSNDGSGTSSVCDIFSTGFHTTCQYIGKVRKVCTYTATVHEVFTCFTVAQSYNQIVFKTNVWKNMDNKNLMINSH